MPGTLFAAMLTPMPVPQTRIARSYSPAITPADLRGLFKDRPVFNLLGGEPEYLDPLKDEAPVGWYVGNCLAGTQVVVPVRCTHEHDAKIVGQVGAEEYCPSVTDGTVFRNNVYFCIDTDA